MSFENSKCPCGETKPCDTMLCDSCLVAFADRREMQELNNDKLPVESRRHSAIILVTLSRQRKRQLQFA
jgi:hypothetical protein